MNLIYIKKKLLDFGYYMVEGVEEVDGMEEDVVGILMKERKLVVVGFCLLRKRLLGDLKVL